MTNLYMGIDPGKSGSITILDDKGNIVDCIKMPETTRDIHEALQKYYGRIKYCVIEKVHARPGNGSAASFTFGKNYGSLLMALVCNDIPFEEITPQKWQKYFELGTSGGEKTEWKNKLKDKSQKMFPHIKVTLQLADSILIAVYCFRVKF